MISDVQWQILNFVSQVVLFLLCFVSIWSALRLLPARKRRWKLARSKAAAPLKAPGYLLKLLMISPREEVWEEKRQLLIGCGVNFDVTLYEAGRRTIGCISFLLGTAGYFGFQRPIFTLFAEPVYFLLAAAIGFIPVIFERPILEYFKGIRSYKIIREVYSVSSQLLYYSGSRMNLHSKLARCLPYTRTIRNEMHLLLNEWYGDAEAAIRRFKIRLGTDEAHSLAETLHSLRLNEDESYYLLLRQRIGDYKEKLELHKESKKETVSYILFVLAGLPILNTFRVFIYPWVAEGQKLFQSIN